MPTATIESNSTVTQRDAILGVILSNGFRVQPDGWLYPQADKVLVRVSVAHYFYRMERRRTPQSVWMRIVETDICDFDQEAFEAWADSWPLTT